MRRKAERSAARSREVPIETRELLLLRESAFGDENDPSVVFEKGAIVWFEVPADAGVEEIEAWRRTLARRGALRAKDLPREAADADISEAAVSRATSIDLRGIASEIVASVEIGIRPDVELLVERALSLALV